MTAGQVLVGLLAWVGHACLWTASLNYLYGNPLPKWFLRPYRLFCGIVIVGFPAIAFLIFPVEQPQAKAEPLTLAVTAYLALCLFYGWLVFPVITVLRLTRRPPECIVAEKTTTLDLWPELGHTAIGNGKFPWASRLPGTCVFRVDLTDLTLAVPGLPPEWEGLTILLVTDTHFHGTPSRAWFDRVFDHLAAGPTPDLVVLGGDYLDSDAHRTWIAPLFSKLRWTEGGYAVVGNHDEYHDPDKTRSELAAAGFRVLSNCWEIATIRGVRCLVVGHEGPWFRPAPSLRDAPENLFRLCISHSPDNFYWGQANRVNLMLCGHVHGGQIRIPVIGSIFVPSVYGRRFDMGVFESSDGGTVMVASRGLSGKEPLRFRCHPQILRLTLTGNPRTPAQADG